MPEVGKNVEYQINDKKLVLKPMTLGKMKKAMAAFKEANGDAFDNIIDHLVVILDNGENPFVNQEWLSDNLTMPIANKIIEDMRTINGMPTRNFPKGEPTLVEKDLQESPAPATPSA